MKHFKILAGALAIAAIVGANVYSAATVFKTSSDLNVSDIENVADGWEWNNFLDWFGQGLRADEKKVETPCFCEHKPRNIKISIDSVTIETSGGSSYSFNSTQVRCDPDGDVNCTKRKCCD